MALQKLYFSGVASRREFKLLQQAGVKRIMVDPFDLKNIPADWDGEVLLDSGAYRAFKQPRKALSVEQLVDFVMEHRQRLTGIVASDIIGQPIASVLKSLRFLVQFEQRAVELGVPERPWVMAVWQWGASPRLLPVLMQWADVVGIGGCQPWLKARSKAEKQQRTENFEALVFLCRSLYQRYGPRTHIFGNCWERSIEALAPVVASSDTSHWMTPKRSGCVVFRHDNGHLAKAPARVLSEAQRWSLDERCVESAKAIARHLEEPGDTPRKVHVSG